MKLLITLLFLSTQVFADRITYTLQGKYLSPESKSVMFKIVWKEDEYRIWGIYSEEKNSAKLTVNGKSTGSYRILNIQQRDDTDWKLQFRTLPVKGAQTSSVPVTIKHTKGSTEKEQVIQATFHGEP
jgi:hypothetical protein